MFVMCAVSYAVVLLKLFYLHVRLHFDALIFRDFAEGRLDFGKFDAALAELNLASKPPKIRDMKSRCAGALRLYKLTAALTLTVKFAPEVYLIFSRVLQH